MGWLSNFKGEFSESVTSFLVSGVYGGKICGAVYTLPNEKTFQIDILIINRKGFFVIENKNYNGWIFGNDKSRKWTACYPNGKKIQFYNPVRQNSNHISMLRNLLKSRYEKEVFFNIITFTTKCDLKKIDIQQPNTYVEYTCNAESRIYSIINNVKDRFDDEGVEKIYRYLLNNADFSDYALSQHINKIKKD